MKDYMTVGEMFDEYCEDYSDKEKKIVLEIYSNSGPKQRELIMDQMSGYINGSGDLFPYDYNDFIMEYGGMGDYPVYDFVHLIMRRLLLTETEFRELEEWILEKDGAEHLEYLRTGPEWGFDILDEVEDTKLFCR